MQQLVDRALVETRFDAVYVHLFRMAPYMARCEGLYRIVDLTDVISQELSCSMPYRGLVSRLLYAVERPRIARYERWVAAHFEETWLISEYDRAVLAADCPQANIRVVRNGVDVAGLVPTGEAELPDSLILVGHMGVFHNIDAARYLVHEILPRVRAQIPGASVSLVGAAPTPEVQSLAAIPGVQVTGFVADLNRALNQASVFVAPLRFAAGVQNKVLEALAAGRPVVATPLVNQGLGASAERDLLVGEQADEIAAQITRLLRDPALRRQLGQAGRRFVEENYSWERVRERMKQIQEGCL
jgi:glycosyltransferase involved in cell wall biosynthesis